MKLTEKVRIGGTIEVLTGMHIGGMKETFQIGGQDSPVIKIRISDDDLPYIPGSSLKGKIRCLLERKHNKYTENGEPCGCGECRICKLFGSHRGKGMQGAVIFRDALLENPESYREDNKLKKDKLFETKPENTIDRIKGTASNPRFIERVLPGTKFGVEIIYNKYEGNNDKELLETLREGFELLADDYIGGSGSRGYGRIDVSSVMKAIENKL